MWNTPETLYLYHNIPYHTILQYIELLVWKLNFLLVYALLGLCGNSLYPVHIKILSKARLNVSHRSKLASGNWLYVRNYTFTHPLWLVSICLKTLSINLGVYINYGFLATIKLPKNLIKHQAYMWSLTYSICTKYRYTRLLYSNMIWHNHIDISEYWYVSHITNSIKVLTYMQYT